MKRRGFLKTLLGAAIAAAFPKISMSEPGYVPIDNDILKQIAKDNAAIQFKHMNRFAESTPIPGRDKLLNEIMKCAKILDEADVPHINRHAWDDEMIGPVNVKYGESVPESIYRFEIENQLAINKGIDDCFTHGQSVVSMDHVKIAHIKQNSIYREMIDAVSITNA